MQNDIKILRELVKQYNSVATAERFNETMKLHRAVNDLKPIRPTVIIDEIPWEQMNFDGSLSLKCEDEFFQEIETNLRQELFKIKYFPADNIFTPYYNLRKIITNTGTGISGKGHFMEREANVNIRSREIQSVIDADFDVENIKLPTITYHEQETIANFNKLSDAIGDLIDIRLYGAESGYPISLKTWDTISNLMTVDDLLYNLIDEPEFMHKLVDRYEQVFTHLINQFEEQNLLESKAVYVHSASTACSDLEPVKDGEKTTAKNLWGRGLAQIFSTVSPEMHDEFDIQYAIKALSRFGLVYYGCCEPLDRKIDILRQIKNLRKISITPWANFENAGQQIKSDYVMSAKANPSALSRGELDVKQVESEISGIINVCKNNNTPLEIILKDISTVSQNPQTLFKWNEIAMGLIK